MKWCLMLLVAGCAALLVMLNPVGSDYADYLRDELYHYVR